MVLTGEEYLALAGTESRVLVVIETSFKSRPTCLVSSKKSRYTQRAMSLMLSPTLTLSSRVQCRGPPKVRVLSDKSKIYR